MSPIDREQIHQGNKVVWSVTAAKYEREEAGDIALLRSGGNSLLGPERQLLGDLRGCRRAIHLQCAGGVDTLSLWRQGAQEVVGIDISPRMIASAQRRSEALAAPAQWLVSDVLDVPHTLDKTADLVYTGRGALPWVMDIGAWAGVVARLVAPNGRVFVFEGHPLDWVWDTDASDYRLDAERGDYFSNRLGVNRRWPTPFVAEEAPATLTQAAVREHQWTLGDILTSLAQAGLRLEHLGEHPDLYWNQYPALPPDLAARLPHTFSLLMRKI